MPTASVRSASARLLPVLCAALCGLLLACAQAQPVRAGKVDGKTDYEGAWSVRFCGRDSAHDECGGFWLYLVQDGERLCGDFYAATPGLGRIDEGGGSWVLGAVEGRSASIVIESTRNGAAYLATAHRDGDRLEWRLVGLIRAGSIEEAPVIPSKTVLARDASPEQVERLRGVVDAPCRWPDAAAAGAD